MCTTMTVFLMALLQFDESPAHELNLAFTNNTVIVSVYRPKEDLHAQTIWTQTDGLYCVLPNEPA